jgi:hypothetical protein
MRPSINREGEAVSFALVAALTLFFMVVVAFFMVARPLPEYRRSAPGIIAFFIWAMLAYQCAPTQPEGRPAMRFTWTGLILAPLPAPVLFSAAALGFLHGDRPVLLFMILLVPGCIVSYGATIFLFLPCLFVLSLRRPVTVFRVRLLGLVLGAAAFVPLTWMEWKSSGPDSGPPTESFLPFFVRWTADPLTAIFPLAGLITAALYWWLVTREPGRTLPAQH